MLLSISIHVIVLIMHPCVVRMSIENPTLDNIHRDCHCNTVLKIEIGLKWDVLGTISILIVSLAMHPRVVRLSMETPTLDHIHRDYH